MAQTPVYNVEEGELEGLRYPVLRIDTSEALGIEKYLERLTMERLDVKAHHDFMQSMQGMSYMPIQEWEWEVCSRMRIWI